MVTADQNALCEKIAALADSMQPELLKFLEKAVNQDSGSYDTEDVNAFGVFFGKGAHFGRVGAPKAFGPIFLSRRGKAVSD